METVEETVTEPAEIEEGVAIESVEFEEPDETDAE